MFIMYFVMCIRYFVLCKRYFVMPKTLLPQSGAYTRDCCVALPRDAKGLFAVCDCGIS